MLIFWILYMSITLLYTCSTAAIFDVVEYGALNDIDSDSSQAFLRAWRTVCDSDIDNPTLLVPERMTFLVNPIVFDGLCTPQLINFQILGEISAPPSPSAWEKHDPGQWLAFREVSGLRIYGSGRVNGQGFGWWNQSCKYHPTMKGCTKLAPTAVKFLRCNETSLSGIHFINSSQTHITLKDCNAFQIGGLKIEAPEKSPNTDGIHLHRSHDVVIANTEIGTGDDCVSVGDRTSNVNVLNVTCGPGHGISIGSLGRGGSYVKVRDVLIRNVNFNGTTNGARIKTWREGRGFVKCIRFENLIFNSVKNPIIVDQNYGAKGAKLKKENGVWISDVKFKNLHGTSSSEVAINLNCSKKVGCTDIILNSIVLWPTPESKKPLTSYCSNAHGFGCSVVQPPSCLKEANCNTARIINSLSMRAKG